MALLALEFLRKESSIDFLGLSKIAMGLSIALIVATLGLLFTRGLNFGIDFTGGILIEAKFQKAPDLSSTRTLLRKQNIGDVSLQNLGDPTILLIRVGNEHNTPEERVKVINTIKDSLATIDSAIDYRKVDYVGPKVGSELIQAGALAMLFALIAIMIYIWIRFEWQFGAGAIIALFHDVILTLGFFSLLQLEFNLSSVAAILTIIGYSINDSVVIFDRIRDNLRKYKSLVLSELLNRSINDNLSRTILTSVTTLLALLALVFLGGHVIQSFSLAALFGVVVGTYSSIYIAAPSLIYMDLRNERSA